MKSMFHSLAFAIPSSNTEILIDCKSALRHRISVINYLEYRAPAQVRSRSALGQGLGTRESTIRGGARGAKRAQPIANTEEAVQVTSFVHLYRVNMQVNMQVLGLGRELPDILTRFVSLKARAKGNPSPLPSPLRKGRRGIVGKIMRANLAPSDYDFPPQTWNAALRLAQWTSGNTSGAVRASHLLRT